MTENFQKIIKNILSDIRVEMAEEFDQNFERQAFFSEAWQRRKSPIRNQNRAILTDTGALRSSIQSRTTDNSVIFYTTLPYAEIHNEGGDIIVTDKMKRFFWAKYRETNGGSWKRQGSHPSLGGAGGGSEAEFWKFLALKKAGSTIRIPRRRFLGAGQDVEKAVRNIIEENITQYVEQAIDIEIRKK